MPRIGRKFRKQIRGADVLYIGTSYRSWEISGFQCAWFPMTGRVLVTHPDGWKSEQYSPCIRDAVSYSVGYITAYSEAPFWSSMKERVKLAEKEPVVSSTPQPGGPEDRLSEASTDAITLNDAESPVKTEPEVNHETDK